MVSCRKSSSLALARWCVFGNRYRSKEKVFPVEVGGRQRLKAGGARMEAAQLTVESIPKTSLQGVTEVWMPY
jgi:hypothetical protein